MRPTPTDVVPVSNWGDSQGQSLSVDDRLNL